MELLHLSNSIDQESHFAYKTPKRQARKQATQCDKGQAIALLFFSG